MLRWASTTAKRSGRRVSRRCLAELGGSSRGRRIRDADQHPESDPSVSRCTAAAPPPFPGPPRAPPGLPPKSAPAARAARAPPNRVAGTSMSPPGPEVAAAPPPEVQIEGDGAEVPVHGFAAPCVSTGFGRRRTRRPRAPLTDRRASSRRRRTPAGRRWRRAPRSRRPSGTGLSRRPRPVLLCLRVPLPPPPFRVAAPVLGLTGRHAGCHRCLASPFSSQ